MNEIKNYEEYQSKLTVFWGFINDIKNKLNFLPFEKIKEQVEFFREKLNKVSELIPILEMGKILSKDNDGNIDFYKIYWDILYEFKQKIGTAYLDQKNITFKYPKISRN